MMTDYHRSLHQERVARLARIASKAVPDDGIDLKRKKTVEVQRKVVEPPPIVQPHRVSVPIVDEDTIQDVRIGRHPPHKAIQAVVCRICENMPVKAMLSKTRLRAVVKVRHLSIFVARIARIHDSLPTIGRNYAYRDHTTILHAIRCTEHRLQHDEKAVQIVTTALAELRSAGWTVPDSLDVVPRKMLPPEEKVPFKRQPQTHCKHGHEFSEENTIRRPNGTRRCRTCQRAYVRMSRRRLLGETSWVRLK